MIIIEKLIVSSSNITIFTKKGRNGILKDFRYAQILTKWLLLGCYNVY